MHQPHTQDEYHSRLDHARRRALEGIMVGSVTWALGLALMFGIPLFLDIGFENPIALINRYPYLPVAMFILMVGWTLLLFLAVGMFMAWLPIHFELGCPHCERAVTLLEDKEVRRTGCCPRCRMPLFARPRESARLAAIGSVKPAPPVVVSDLQSAPTPAPSPAVVPAAEAVHPGPGAG